MTQNSTDAAARRELAASFIARGFAVLILHDVSAGQCSCGEPRCLSKPRNQGKHPRMGRGWEGQGLTDPAAVGGWLAQFPECNLGILTGPPSGCWVLDVDPVHGGDVALAELERTHGPLPYTYTVRTGSGGHHHYFALPEDFTPTNANRLPTGLDSRGAGGQVVAPGSRTLLGDYRVSTDAPLADAPGWLLDLVRPRAVAEPENSSISYLDSRNNVVPAAPPEGAEAVRLHAYAVGALSAELERLAGATPGNRGFTAFKVACNLLELINSPWARLNGEQVWQLYMAAAHRAMEHGGGFDAHEAVSSWSSAAREIADQGRPVPPPPALGGVVELSGLPAGSPPFDEGPATTALGAGVPAASAGSHVPGMLALGPAPIPAQRAQTPAPDAPFASGGERLVSDPRASMSPGMDPLVEFETVKQLQRMRAQRAARAVLDAEDATAADSGRAARAAALRASMLTAGELAARPGPQPLVKGLLNLNTTSWLIGKSGSYKSFVALDLAAHVATGRDWQGRATHGGPVVYLIGEGVDGMAVRMRAWEARHGTVGDKLVFLPRPVSVKDTQAWDDLVAVCEQIGPALVIADTQARMSVGLKENDNTEMMMYVDAVDRLRQATGACVLTVHHIGRNGQDARGASSIDGAQDAELRVERLDTRSIRLHQDKQKDNDDTDTLDIALEVEGPSLVLADAPAVALALNYQQKREQRRERNRLSMLDRVMELLPDVYASGTGGTKAEIRRAVFERLGRPGAGDERSSTWDKVWNQLVTLRVLGRIKGTASWIYIPMDERRGLVEPVPGGAGFYAPSPLDSAE